MRVYLCGGINGLSDSECKDWRELAKREIGEGNCIDPMRRDYRGVEVQNISKIVELDKADIDDCDVVLVNATRSSWGTAMELFYAYSKGKDIVAFTGDAKVSPWVSYHSRTVPFLGDAIKLIVGGVK